MATAKKDTSAAPKMTPAQVRKENEQLKLEIDNLKEEIQKYKTEYGYCRICGKLKKKDQFYISTDPMVTGGITSICKKCAYDIALRKDKNNEYHDPTKESIQEALYYMDKPYIDTLYTSSVAESANDNGGRLKSNAWTAYVKNVAMPNYIGMRYKDSDMFKEHIIYEDEKTIDDVIRGKENQDTYSDFIKNKNDVIRLLSYDPFDKESISDQPFLYSQLLGLLDTSEDANDDMMRTASAISIVRNFLQQSKIDDTIAKLMGDITQVQKNSSTIKALQDSKSKTTSIIKDLAAESCISLKNNKQTKKGENTWTGKLKKIKDMNLREGEVNGFDIATCKGMRQVMDQSNASIIQQLHLDESEYSDMLAEQREMIVSLRRDLDSYKEISRILLRENIDLKDYLEEHGISNPNNLVDLDELFSCFNAPDKESEQDGD